MSERLLTAAQSVCERRGYDVTAPDKPWLPPRIATPTANATPFVSRTSSDAVALEPLTDTDVSPTMLLSRLRNNAGHDRFSLFVVSGEATAETVRTVLCDPPLVAGVDDTGPRTFYNGPDRIPLAGGGYAAVRTDSSPDELFWREVGDDDAPALHLFDTGAGAQSSRQASGAVADAPPVLSLDGVDELACPPAGAFPYSYRRDDDKQFRVRRGDGTVVGVYDGVAALRANAYVPLPMPLVPEHVFSGISSVRDEWAVLFGAGGDAGDAGGGSFRLLTADDGLTVA